MQRDGNNKGEGGIDRREENRNRMKRVPQIMGQDVSKVSRELNRSGG